MFVEGFSISIHVHLALVPPPLDHPGEETSTFCVQLLLVMLPFTVQVGLYVPLEVYVHVLEKVEDHVAVPFPVKLSPLSQFISNVFASVPVHVTSVV